MKRISKMMAVVLCLALVLCLFAGCGTDGTYYRISDDGSKNTSDWIEIDGESWKDSSGFEGSCVITDDSMTLYVVLLGMEMELMSGTRDGNMVTFDIYGVECVYSK